MAIRILPFRQYNETDVINMFALDTAYVNTATTDSGQTAYGDAGVFVTVAAGDLNKDPVTYTAGADQFGGYLGKTDYPFVGANSYPSVSLRIKPATTGDAPTKARRTSMRSSGTISSCCNSRCFHISFISL